MILTEEIGSVLTWGEIKAHLRLDDDSEKELLQSFGLAAAEAFEEATGVAAAYRESTLIYSRDDLKKDINTLLFPKVPVAQITSVVGESSTLLETDYELRRIGKRYYLHLFSVPSTPITVTYYAGHAAVPQLIKTACLLHVEHLYRNRGATSQMNSNVVAFGLQNIYDLYNVNKAVVG